MNVCGRFPPFHVSSAPSALHHELLREGKRVVNLDDPTACAVTDVGDMLRHLRGFPEQVETAWAAARTAELAPKYADIFSLVILGVGAAAAAGDLLRGLVAHRAQIPVFVSRGYDLPAFVGPDSLAVAVSHSGNTEETLTPFEEAADRGAKLVIVAGGGTLAERATWHRAPLLTYPAETGTKPRAALGYLLASLLAVAHKVHLTPNPDADMAEAVALLAEAQTEWLPETPTERNPAKQIAHTLHRRVPAVYGAGIMASVAGWWRGQLNANAKVSALADVPPEVNHLATGGYAGGTAHLAAVQLRSSYDHPRLSAHWTVTSDLLARAGIPSEVVEARGQSRLAQTLWAVALGDWVSYYLALLNNTDPTAEEAIAYLKQHFT